MLRSAELRTRVGGDGKPNAFAMTLVPPGWGAIRRSNHKLGRDRRSAWKQTTFTPTHDRSIEVAFSISDR